jgi:dTDP-4-dehydrorhamnose reductase
MLARACDAVGARVVYPSTDYVFDGSATRPYRPDDVPRPINAYGRSKLLGERAVRIARDGLIVRIAWLYGPERSSFVRAIVERARRLAEGGGAPLRVVADQVGRPTSTRVAAEAIAGLLERRAPAGVYHATGAGPEVTRHDLARAALEAAGLAQVPTVPVTSEEFAAAAARPRYSVLDLTATEALLGPLPDWRGSLRDAIAHGLF